jgi:ribosomal-protein-serine acetyltransferase
MALPRRLDAVRVRLEATTPDHAEAIWKAKELSLDELRPWMDWADDDRDATATFTQRCQQKWSAGLEWNFTIVEDVDEVIGCTSLHAYDPRYRKAEVGYWIRSDRARRGLVPEAVSCLIAFGFESILLHRIELHCGIENSGSIRVAEKLGFTREGTLRQALRTSSEWYDAYMYALLASDDRPRLHLPA